ncbi:hypothetical protein OG946_02290 [Streptomyces sp. NBC_01808]|uniref:hypothetical protein n=1 Tax=Streptomyces sp. NBC_01808 TaxID=2975947 RepID=UPI002DDA10E5|nr:hypothetical protein [Streptomyces sp. NBC_01808]WSA36302.1 hypothetical protein OG946_02290 [Streptomyces sp. NBC_01808]
MKGITFPAWQGSRYVTPAELVVCLGDFSAWEISAVDTAVLSRFRGRYRSVRAL